MSLNIIKKFIGSIKIKHNSTSPYLVFLENGTFKLKFTEHSIVDIIDGFNFKQLIFLDKSFRDRDLFYGNCSIQDVEKIAKNNDELLAFICLTTFHRSGYLREKAIDRLIEINDKRSIPFLILRSNDWVYEIRNKVKKTLLSKINQDSFADVTANYSLLKHTSRYKQAVSDEIDKRIQLLSESVSKEKIISSVKNSDDRGKIFCYLILMDRNLVTAGELLELINKEQSHSVKEVILVKLIKKMPLSELLMYKDKLYMQKSARVRVELIRQLSDINYFTTQEALKFALKDKYSRVRKIGEYYILKLGEFNFLNFYKNEVAKNSKDIYSLYGFLEYATIKEIDEVKDYLSNEKPSIVAKTMEAIARIDFRGNIPLFMNFLENEDSILSSQSRRILVKNKDSIYFNDIYNIYKHNNNAKVQKNCMLILKEAPKWSLIAYILEFIVSEDQEISFIGNTMYKNWISNFNKTYSSPTALEEKAVLEIVENYESKLGKKKSEYIRFVLK